MRRSVPCGMLVLDRKGEYIEDTIDQHRNAVFGLHRHPMAPERMVVVSSRDFSHFEKQGRIHAFMRPQFSIRDVDPADLADFLTGLTAPQAELLSDYAHVAGFYEKLLGETQFGAVDNRTWYSDFPGLFNLKANGKKLVKKFEDSAIQEGRDALTDDEIGELEEFLTGTGAAILERAASRIKRFCLNPFFGGSARGRDILAAPSCVNKVLRYLQEDKCVFVDMRGRQDDEYTMLAALLARRLLTENRKRADADQIRACLIMEEAHNILSEEELYKGGGRGSVFIELAREGRSFKIGFILVTQQPDARSIAQQVVKTIDTVIAFHMPPDDAKYLQRLKPGFTGLELEIANAETFQGIAVADSGPVLFKSEPVNDRYMAACASGTLASHICGSDSTSVRMSGQRGGEVAPPAEADKEPGPAKLSINERLLRLSKARQENIEKVALDTMRAWRDDSLGLSDRNEAAG